MTLSTQCGDRKVKISWRYSDDKLPHLHIRNYVKSTNLCFLMYFEVPLFCYSELRFTEMQMSCLFEIQDNNLSIMAFLLLIMECDFNSSIAAIVHLDESSPPSYFATNLLKHTVYVNLFFKNMYSISFKIPPAFTLFNNSEK